MHQALFCLVSLLVCSALLAAERFDDPAAWTPMAGSPAAERISIDGGDAIRLPITLKGNPIPRASWDCAANLDLSLAGGLQFEAFCKDPTPVANFSIYFQSGEGWYTGTFAPSAEGWNTVRVRKEDTGMQSSPRGWTDIRTIRISAWRGQSVNTELYVRNFRPLTVDSSIALVRADSTAELRPAERETAINTSRQLARLLSDLGLPYLLISDRDLDAQRLAQCKLLILPHNPTMPPAGITATTAWLASGGRLAGFFSMPAEISKACGLTFSQFVRQERVGQFASIAADPTILEGAPPRTSQRSWNLNELKPVDDRMKVAARWLDDAGNDTGHPAVLVSDRAAYMNHILLPDDQPRKRELLAAIIARLLPETREVRAKAAIDGIGRFSSFKTLGELKLYVQGKRGQQLAERAAATSAKAGEALASGDANSACRLAESARELALQAWCQSQDGQANEFRGLWCHRPFGIDGMTWDESLKVLAENGFTAIVPNMAWGGSAAYASKVLPVSDVVAQRGDQLAQCINAAHKLGLQVHVWKVNWNMGWSSSKEFVDRMKAEGRTQLRFDGTSNEAWLCPSNPLNQQLEIDAMVEIASSFAVDGIHFDYIRYPDQDHCFCPGCRERFEETLGLKVKNWPADVRRDEALRDKWLDFRRSNITKVVAEVSRLARQKHPGIKISAAVFSNWPTDRDSVGQDWKLWCERGYLDFVCPMDYTQHNSQFESRVIGQKTWAGSVPVYPGIGLSTWPSRDPVKLIEQIEITRKHNTGGFMIFEYDRTEAQGIVPLLGLGITRP